MLGSRETNTRGIIISRMSSGEGSTRVSIYTERYGLIWAIARSAREERSKLRPHLQVGTYGMFTLIKGSHDWRVLGAVDTVSSYFSLLESKEAQKGVVRVLGVVRQLIQGESPEARLFDSFWEFLNTIPSVSDENIPLAERLVLTQILSVSGYISNDKIPSISEYTYSEDTFNAIKSHEKEITIAINEGFSASGLI